MSELKVYVMPLKTNIFGKTIVGQAYYSKSEADKVIAELEEKINEAQTELELWRDGSIISESHQKEIDEKRHSDYKRCLALKEVCLMELYYAFRDPCVERSAMKCVLWRKWANRWHDLAEMFKEA